MKKNHDLHFLVSKDLKTSLKKKAEKLDISLAELCRRKLGEDSQLERIEEKLNKWVSKVGGGNN